MTTLAMGMSAHTEKSGVPHIMHNVPHNLWHVVSWRWEDFVRKEFSESLCPLRGTIHISSRISLESVADDMSNGGRAQRECLPFESDHQSWKMTNCNCYRRR